MGRARCRGPRFHNKAVCGRVGILFDWKDPRNIEDNFQVLYRGGFYRGGPVLSSAISGLEQAMWDIKGKFYNAPVYELLGGKVRDKVQMYCQAGSVEDVLDKKAAGYRAFKLGSLGATGYVDTYRKIDEKLKAIAAIRDAVGYEVDLAIDFHGEVHRPMAKVLAKELEQFKMMFIEEPVLCDNMEAFARNRPAYLYPHRNRRTDVYSLGLQTAL